MHQIQYSILKQERIIPLLDRHLCSLDMRHDLDNKSPQMENHRQLLVCTATVLQPQNNQ